MKENLYYKELTVWGVLLSIFQIVLTWVSLISNEMSQQLINVLFVMVALLVAFWIFTYRKNIIGPIVGIILGIVYIFSGDLINIVIGIGLIIDCFRFIKSLENKAEF